MRSMVAGVMGGAVSLGSKDSPEWQCDDACRPTSEASRRSGTTLICDVSMGNTETQWKGTTGNKCGWWRGQPMT